ncbi:dephospho-CoA kinase [Flavobacteriaceae bacterium]|nr:dephospho-CoA kinase [Flavobacteriaceae bacterium]
MTKILGITGGIGSGKTTVASLFSALGVPVYNADNEAKKLMNESPKIRTKLIELFGVNAYSDGLLNRSYIAQLVFKDKNKLDALNQIIHPEVATHYSAWLATQAYPYVVKEVAILFELGAEDQFDFILTVTAPKQSRIDRVMQRDTKTSEEVLSIIKNQWDEALKINKSDFVIYNIDTQLTAKEVEEIHIKILKII